MWLFTLLAQVQRCGPGVFFLPPSSGESRAGCRVTVNSVRRRSQVDPVNLVLLLGGISECAGEPLNTCQNGKALTQRTLSSRISEASSRISCPDEAHLCPPAAVQHSARPRQLHQVPVGFHCPAPTFSLSSQPPSTMYRTYSNVIFSPQNTSLYSRSSVF